MGQIMLKLQDVITKLGLIPLPKEGGYYRETYRSSRYIQSPDLGRKSECTAIYYLITRETFSALHVVDQDEIFHFYAGSPVQMFQINSLGESRKIVIGNDLEKGQVPQVIVPHGTWQGTKLLNPQEDNWALLGCTVSPGFDFENFHILDRAELSLKFPQHIAMIREFTNP